MYKYDLCCALVLTWINGMLTKQPPVLLVHDEFPDLFTFNGACAQKIVRRR
jgi:hypothetical protein